MIRYTVAAVLFAVAPLSLAVAAPTPPTDRTPPANCPQIQQHMGDGAMSGPGQMMQHGDGSMGSGTMGHGNMGTGAVQGQMQGQMMQHGDHQAMMQGQAPCPAASKPADSKPADSKPKDGK